MKRVFFSLLALTVTTVTAFTAEQKPAGIPENYRLLYSQNFSSPDALKDFVFTDANAWNLADGDGRKNLELTKQSAYKPEVRSPVNIALIAGWKFGDFIVEADCLQTGKEYGHRDMCFFYGFQSPTKFYYTHIATKADPNAHNCFIVNDAPRKNIARETTDGANWGLGIWRHIRLERKASDGTIRVWFDDMTKPIMLAEDKTHGPGWIGFGSFDDTGRVSNIKVWGEKAEPARVPEFPKK